MSKYTTELRFICEQLAGLEKSVGYEKVDEVIEKAIPKIFDFEFPIFDQAYAYNLERKFLMHFYTREICVETYGLWRLRLEDKLNTIMPYYNKLYESELLEFNPFYDVDLTREHHGNKDDVTVANGTSNGNITGKTHNSENGTITDSNIHSERHAIDEKTDHKHSDTPQGSVTNMDDGYLTDFSKDTKIGNNEISANDQNNRTIENQTNGTNESKNTNTVNSNSTVNSTDQYIEHIFGKQGGRNNSKLLMEFRKTFLNIDNMILEEMEDLFFQLW